MGQEGIAEVKHVLITYQRAAVPQKSVADMMDVLQKFGFSALMLAVWAPSMGRVIEVYGLDNLTQIELDEVRKMCEEHK